MELKSVIELVYNGSKISAFPNIYCLEGGACIAKNLKLEKEKRIIDQISLRQLVSQVILRLQNI
jgi:hypothetical protein